MTTFIDGFGKIALALFIGGLVGLERERRDLPAGVRTHMLVCAGSALFTLASILMAGSRADPTRVAAQIVSGIGFLGAGTIFRSGPTVRGLTTAAGLWLVAGVGMGIAAGGPLQGLAVVTGLLVAIVNIGIRDLEQRWLRPSQAVRLTLAQGSDALVRLAEGLAQRGVLIQQVECLPDTPELEAAAVRLFVRVPAAQSRSDLAVWMSQQPGVRRITWE
jgi:putative Mg2+ transporter-C (MgtC) family protein